MRITKPYIVNALREHAERSGRDEEAVVIVQGISREDRGDNRQDWEKNHSYLRVAPKGSADRPTPYGAIITDLEMDNCTLPPPGYYWIDVDGTMVDKTEEFGKPDPEIDGWAGIWRI